ncbi:MAG: lipopolysaccharide biosynthesis protein [Acidobacteria bacterium]|nr:lipopolysaccharide biosynthesis protein [Acidobacteriota bacterium]
MSTMTRTAFTALRWNYVGFFARSGSNFMIGILLARLLGPKPFGQIAAAMLVIGIANLITDAGFTSALIQTPALTDLQIRYVFTSQFLIALGMTLVCALASPWVASAFHDPAVRGVLLAISPLFLLQACGQTSNALLRRKLAFRTLQIAEVSSYLLGYLLVGVPLAFAGAGVWSLVAAQMTQSTINAALLYFHVRHSIYPTFDRSGRHLLRFGVKVTLTNIVNYGISNTDTFVVGHWFGSTSLGFYNRAFNLPGAPADGVVNSLQGVLFASCSRAEGRLGSLRRAYLACLAAIAFIVLPPFWAVAAAPATVMVGLYGERWRSAAPLLRPLALALSLHALMAMAGPILSAVNLVEREVYAQLRALVVTLAIFWIAVRFSVHALAWGVLVAYLCRFLLATYPTLRVLQLQWNDVLRVLAGPVLVAILSAVSVGTLNVALMHAGLPPSVAILLLLSTGSMVVLLAIVLAKGFFFPAEFGDLLRKGMTGAPPAAMRLLLGQAAFDGVRGAGGGV